MNPASWLVRLSRPASDSPTLLICPHAGGCPMFYRELAAVLGDRLTVWAVNYPGRERQVRVPLPESLPALADSVAQQAIWRLPGALVLLGHSMGAVVAHEVARRLPDQVQAVIVSAHASPLAQRVDRGLHLASDETLLQQVESLGASPTGLLRHPEFGQYLLSVLRQDFQITETHQPCTEPLDIPLVAYGGDQDLVAPPESLRSWERMTTARFRWRIFPGGHFYFLGDLAATATQLHHDVMWCLAFSSCPPG